MEGVAVLVRADNPIVGGDGVLDFSILQGLMSGAEVFLVMAVNASHRWLLILTWRSSGKSLSSWSTSPYLEMQDGEGEGWATWKE